MAWESEQRWPGRVWVKNGTRTYYIRQWRGDKRYDCTTKTHSLRAALRELERFEKDPANYRPAGSEEQLVLDDALIERYRAWCETKSKRAPEPQWLRAKVLLLEWWRDQLQGRDLRVVQLRELHEAMEHAPNERDRTVVVKHLYTFLRTKGLVRPGDDPTLKAMPVEQGAPAQLQHSKVIPEEDVRAVLPHLPPLCQDIIRIGAAVGCHLTEVLRFMETGTVEPGSAYGLEGDVLTFIHKSGRPHKVPVSSAVGLCARRLKAWDRKAPTRKYVYGNVERACVKAGVQPWTPGRFRHTVLTRSVRAGQAPAEAALAAGHIGGAKTTMTFYVDGVVAPKVRGGIE